MLKIYCRSCGSPTEYSINKPKLCCQCGTSFASVSSFTPIPPKTVSSPKKILKMRPEIDEDDYESEADLISEVPNIEKLDFQILGNKVTGIKLGNVIGTSSTPAIYEEPKDVKVLSKKEVLEQFRRDAGKTSRIELNENENFE